MKESDDVFVGPRNVTVIERGPYRKQRGFVAPDGLTFITITEPEIQPDGFAKQERHDSLVEDYARSQRRGRWILRALTMGVLIAAAFYARWLCGRL